MESVLTPAQKRTLLQWRANRQSNRNRTANPPFQKRADSFLDQFYKTQDSLIYFRSSQDYWYK